MIYLAHSPAAELRKGFSLGDDGSLIEHDPQPTTHYEYERRNLASLDDAFTLLTELVDDPHRAIVMGKPLGERGTRVQEFFETIDRRFWILDLDGAPLDGDPQRAIEACLPFLQGRSYVYAYSQSAGLKDGLRCRVVCELPRKHTPAELKALARHYNTQFTAYAGIKRAVVDSTIYTKEHFIFTSRPRLMGVGDPHPVRVHMVHGDGQPVTLDRLPDMIEIAVKSNVAVSELPALEGFGKEGGDGQGRSLHAHWGLRRLRTFMDREDSDHDWEDEEKRTRLWHQMLTDAGATDYEWIAYGTFHMRHAKHARPAEDEETIFAVANPDNSVPLDVAENRLRSALREAVQSTEPRVTAIRVTMGTGKTRQALIEIAHELQARVADSPQFGEFYVDWYSPTVETAQQTLATAESFDLNAFVELGRGQELGGRPVCFKHEAAGVVSTLVSNTAEKLCRDAAGNVCEFYAGCRWQWQRNHTLDLPLRIRNHSHLQHVVRSEHNEAHRPIDLVVIDEDFFKSLCGNLKVSIADVVSPTRLPADAFAWVQRFAGVLNEGLTIEALEAAGFTEDVCTALIKAEEALAPEIDVNPSMSADASLKAAQKADKRWLDYARVWRRLRDCLRSRSMNRLYHPAGQDFLVLNWKRAIRSIPWDHETNRPKVPVIVMSGTMDRDVLEQFLPVDEWHEIDVQPHPGAHIRQSDLRGSKTELLYGSSPERIAKGETDDKKREDAAAVRRLVKEVSQGTALITFKEFEDLEGADGHFNATEGRNDFTARDLTIEGRPLPSPHVVEDLARAVYCDDPRPVRALRNFYPQRAVARRGDGYAMTAYHPDARAERLRWLVCEGEMMQAVARCRYVRHPVHLTILNRTPLPLRIDEVVSHHRLHPDWRRLNEGRVLPLSSRELIRLFPGAFSDKRSAQREGERRAVDFHEERKALLIEYRRAGARGRPNRALVDGWAAIKELGPVAAELADDPRNDYAVAWRDMRDALAREPIEVGPDDEIEVVGSLVPVAGLLDGVSMPRWRAASL